MRDEIVLIGPMGAGTSTQGALLAARLGVPQCSIDELRWEHDRDAGYDEDLARRTHEAGGFVALYWYWKPFEIDSLERLLTERHGCVFDLGAGQSVFEHRAFFERARRAVAPVRTVVLLLPSADDAASLRELRRRIPDEAAEAMAGAFDLNAHLVAHPSNRALATHVVYTAGRTPAETRDELLRVTGLGG